MKSVILIAIFVAFVSAGCLSPLQTAKTQSNTQCYWYNSNSCCQNPSITFNSSNCPVPSQGCQDQITLLSCGIICSPQFSSAESGTQIRYCSSFADKIYSSCKNDQFYQNGACKTLGSVYSSGQNYVQSFNGIYDTTDSSPTCFNSAGTQTISVALLFALAAFFL